MRLSLKLFVALSIMAGPVLGLAPDASAHLRTSSTAEVTGAVAWPGRDVAGFGLPRGLNGCVLTAAQIAALAPDSPAGLPLGIPNQPQQQEDRCFEFVSLVIQAQGEYEGVQHVTAFTCLSSGTSTTNAGRLGAFYGEFECGGAAPMGSTLSFVDNADGHFHGLSRDTTVAFLGVVCDPEPPLGGAGSVAGGCPAGNVMTDDDGNPTTAPMMETRSAIKHTLSCEGEVTPATLSDTVDPYGLFPAPDGIPDSVATADVKLTCVIA